MTSAPAAALLVLLASGAAGAETGALGPTQVFTVKALVAGAGTALLAIRWLARGWEDLPPRWQRAWDAALALLGLLAAAGWWNLFQFNFPGFGHPSETYHYYVGAKYFPELRYTGLYACTALADAEAGGDVARRPLRELGTNRIASAGAVLERAPECRARFTPERWRAFAHDVAFFRERLPPRRWGETQVDHGYNATPVWGAFGALFARMAPASDAQILALRLLDPLLLSIGFGAVAWAFGWRTLCVALLYFGTNYPAQYGWVGGSYLRQLEISALLVALSLLRRGCALGGGGLLSLAALVRIYPGLLAIGPAFQWLGSALRRSAPAARRPLRRAAVGGLLAAGLLLPIAALTSGGAVAWSEFAENSRVLMQTPMRNTMGLRTLLAHAPGGRAPDARAGEDPIDAALRAREAVFAPRRPLFAALVAAYVALLALAVQRQPVWVAAVLSAGLVPVALELTCYYAAVLVVFALLWEHQRAVGTALAALSLTGWLLVERFHFYDAVLPWLSGAQVLLAVLAALLVWRRPGPETARDARAGQTPSRPRPPPGLG